MNIHQLYGKVVSSPSACAQVECNRFTFLYYSFSPNADEMQANFIEVEMDKRTLQDCLPSTRYELNGSKLLLSGYFYQKRWQDKNGIFHMQFHFYAYHLEPLELPMLSSLSA